MKKAKRPKPKAKRPKPKESSPVPSGDSIPVEEIMESIRDSLEELAQSGHYLIAFFHLNGNQIRLNWFTRDFLTGDFPQCLDMLESELEKIRKSKRD